MLLTEFPFRVGSCRVEVAESYPLQPVGLLIPLERSLDEKFGLSVRVCWLLRASIRISPEHLESRMSRRLRRIRCGSLPRQASHQAGSEY